MPQALKVINEISDFVESKNTLGSGQRFALKFKNAIKRLAQPNVQYSPCNHPVLASRNYSCSLFNDWVIAFRVLDGTLVVYEIIRSSVLY